MKSMCVGVRIRRLICLSLKISIGGKRIRRNYDLCLYVSGTQCQYKVIILTVNYIKSGEEDINRLPA